jgi:uncharacterized integral membrane protein
MAGSTATHKSSHSTGGVNRARLTRIIVAAVALIYAIIFIALNRGRVRIHFLFFTVTSRLWVGLLVCLALGALLGHGFGVYRRRRPTRPGSPAQADAPKEP